MSTYTGSDKAINFLFDMVSNIANDYDETSTYAVNDYAVFEGVLYKCTSAIATAETFTPAHWAAVLVMNEIAAGGGGGGSSTLAGLSDVSLSSVANGDVLTFDSALNKWKNAVGGGSGGHTYSLTEHVVGTWTDGSTIYERTYDTGILPNATNKDVAHGITNLDKVISLVGFAIRTSDNTQLSLPLVNTANIQNQIEVSVRGTAIRITTKIDRTPFTISYMTMQYTKTS